MQSAGLDAALETSGVQRALPPAVDLTAYRLVQEALTNCLRHAGPARVVVRARYDDATLRLDVVDDGLGGVDEGAARTGGHGLLAMRERVSMVGGTLEVGPQVGGGWAVLSELPTTVVTSIGSASLERESS